MDGQAIANWPVAATAVAGVLLLGLAGLMILSSRRRHTDRFHEPAKPSAAVPPGDASPSIDAGRGVRAPENPQEPRRPPATPADGARDSRPSQRISAADPRALALAARSSILQAVAERCPAGWRPLVLVPPEHASQMTWHVHPNADVALDLLDGRTVPTTPPPDDQVWTLPSGRVVGFRSGDLVPSPGAETRVVRVAGPYIKVLYRAGQPGSFLVQVPIGKAGQHEYRAPADRPERLATLLEQALMNTIGDRRGSAAAMGYSPRSWTAHERLWLEIRDRPR